MAVAPRPLFWVGPAREELLAFPDEVRREMGYAHFLAQIGSKHVNAKVLRGGIEANMGEKVRTSSGNVFADLELEEADLALAKAELAARISAVIEQRGLTQRQAANVLGIDQPKVSALVRGRLTAFSTERLIRFLNALGRDVEIVVHAPARTRSHGRTFVAAGGAPYRAGPRRRSH